MRARTHTHTHTRTRTQTNTHTNHMPKVSIDVTGLGAIVRTKQGGKNIISVGGGDNLPAADDKGRSYLRFAKK